MAGRHSMPIEAKILRIKTKDFWIKLTLKITDGPEHLVDAIMQQKE